MADISTFIMEMMVRTPQLPKSIRKKVLEALDKVKTSIANAEKALRAERTALERALAASRSNRPATPGITSQEMRKAEWIVCYNCIMEIVQLLCDEDGSLIDDMNSRVKGISEAAKMEREKTDKEMTNLQARLDGLEKGANGELATSTQVNASNKAIKTAGEEAQSRLEDVEVDASASRTNVHTHPTSATAVAAMPKEANSPQARDTPLRTPSRSNSASANSPGPSRSRQSLGRRGNDLATRICFNWYHDDRCGKADDPRNGYKCPFRHDLRGSPAIIHPPTGYVHTPYDCGKTHCPIYLQREAEKRRRNEAEIKHRELETKQSNEQHTTPTQREPPTEPAAARRQFHVDRRERYKDQSTANEISSTPQKRPRDRNSQDTAVGSSEKRSRPNNMRFPTCGSCTMLGLPCDSAASCSNCFREDKVCVYHPCDMDDFCGDSACTRIHPYQAKDGGRYGGSYRIQGFGHRDRRFEA